MNQKFTACLTNEDGKLCLGVYSSAMGITPLGNRHERSTTFPDAVYEFFKPSNAGVCEIALAALEAAQDYFDREFKKGKKKK